MKPILLFVSVAVIGGLFCGTAARSREARTTLRGEASAILGGAIAEM